MSSLGSTQVRYRVLIAPGSSTWAGWSGPEEQARRFGLRSRSAYDSLDSEPGGESAQLLATVGAYPDDHQQAQLVDLQPELEEAFVEQDLHVVGPASERALEVSL